MACFELVHALIFASLIVVACINASSQFRAIFIDANIPVGICFFFLEKLLERPFITDDSSVELTYFTFTDWIVAVCASI